MDQSDILNILREFTLLPQSFTLQEFRDSADSDVDCENLQKALLNDERFIFLGHDMLGDEIFISKSSFFRWFTHLSLRLARAHQIRLTAKQLAINNMSSLRINGQWNVSPSEAVDFAHQFGFVAFPLTPGEYIFPLAHILSNLPKTLMSIAGSILESFAEEENRNAILQKPMEYWMEEVLSKFDERVIYVVKHRLLNNTPATLREIALELGITRERVRQIEIKFYNKILHPIYQKALLKVFLCEIIRRKGSLIIRTDASLLRFLVKCIGMPQTEIPHADLIILGTLAKNIASLKSLCRWYDLIDANVIADHLESKGRICISKSDLRVICETIANSCRRRLTKAQRVCIALRRLGKPTHYLEVAKEYNHLFSESTLSEHNVHAILNREEYGVVWIGIKGTFALKEWGYSRPSETLHKTVEEVVKKFYKKTHKPVSLRVIAGEIGKYRKLVKISSLTIAAHCNPKLQCVFKDSFIPKELEDLISSNRLDKALRGFRDRNF